VLRYLPNTITFLRLLLAAPLGLLILRQQYDMALAVGFLAGVSDALDGWAARRLGYFSQFGAALDPVADKVLITVSFLCSAQVGLIPWYLAVTVIARDLIIVCGALCYRLLIGPFEFGATALSKLNMLVQISFCVLLLATQVVAAIGNDWLFWGGVLVIAIAVASGLDYMLTWAGKALRQRREM
jgi:cardiolipin synthase